METLTGRYKLKAKIMGTLLAPMLSDPRSLTFPSREVTAQSIEYASGVADAIIFRCEAEQSEMEEIENEKTTLSNQ